MAAKKKASKKTKKSVGTEGGSGGGSSFWRSAGALLLILLGIVVLFGAFIDAPVPASIWNGSWWTFGAGALLVPPALVYLGILKFKSDDQQIPLSKMLGVIGSLTFIASFLHTAFVKQSPDLAGIENSGHGGEVGALFGDIIIGLLGQFLSMLLFLFLSVIILFFTLHISPKVLLKMFGIVKKRDKSEGEEDLGSLKQRIPGFKMNEGVPVEHHEPNEQPEKAVPRLASLKNTAQKMTTTENHAALTTASDPEWQYPPISLLSAKQDKADAGDVQGNAETIRETFNNFNIDVEVEGANIGPRVTQYTIKPPTGVKLTKLTALEDNLRLDLAAHSIRMEAPIPGKRAVGIEVPNVKPATVTIHSLVASQQWRELKSPLGFVIGKDIAGVPVVGDLAAMPHLLIAGQTGAGKSVMINTFLTSLLYRNSPADLKLILVDPKEVEMALYRDIPHLLAPVMHEPEQCISALKWAVAEMQRRLKTFAEVGRRNIAEYNKLKAEEGMPYIVIVIDELAELMMMAARDVEALIVRLAQKARASGIHLVLATQRPSVDVITGLIKANVPARIAFTTVSQIDSRTIIDQMGAEKLLGKGDLLFNTSEFTKPKRVQGAFISDDETTKICDYLRAQRPPTYDEEVISQPVQLNGKGGIVMQMSGGGEEDDDAFKDAVRVVIDTGKASTSLLQRKLRIGYGKASRYMDIMEEKGIIGAADGSKPRDVLVRSVDDVFGSDGGGSDTGGDVYDDMPDEDERTA